MLKIVEWRGVWSLICVVLGRFWCLGRVLGFFGSSDFFNLAVFCCIFCSLEMVFDGF